jgi:hypothetical protein
MLSGESDVLERPVVERSELGAIAGASAPFAHCRDDVSSGIAQCADRVALSDPISRLMQVDRYHVKSPNLG